MTTKQSIVASEFKADILGGLPGAGSLPFQFHRAGQHTHSEGLVVHVVCHGAPGWVGNFQRGDGGLDAIYETPSSDHLCAVAGGTGYWVSVKAPEQYELISIYPIREVRVLLDAGLLLLVSLTNLAAYGAEGFKWQTSRVSWDRIKVLEASARGIRGIAWDAPAEREVGFFVDPLTGSHEGGASP